MRKHRFLLTTLAMVWGCAIVDSAWAQKVTEKFRMDTHAIRRILWNVLAEGDKKPDVLTDWRQLNDPAHTILVILGKPHDKTGWPVLNRIPNGFRNFVRAGGAVLLATDSRLENQDLTWMTGYSVTGGSVAGWPKWDDERQFNLRADTLISKQAIYRGLDEDAYKENRNRGLRECLIVRPISSRLQKELFLHPNLEKKTLFLNLVTNKPSFLAGEGWGGENTTVLARFPNGCYYLESAYLPRFSTTPAFAVAAQPGRGRLLFMADHSVFINEMLLQEDKPGDDTDDIGNVAFAYNTLEWLRGDQPKRHKALFVIDGKIETKLDIPLKIIPISLKELQQKMTRQGNIVMKKLNDKVDSMNEGVVRGLGRGPGRIFGRRGGSYRGYILLIITVLTIALVIYAIRRMRRASYGIEAGAPLLVSALTRARPDPEVHLHRQEMLLSADNLAVHARALARECLTGSPVPGTAAQSEPVITAHHGSKWQQRRLIKLARWVWQVAFAPGLPRMTKAQFQKFLDQLHELREALKSRKIQVKNS